MSLKANSVTASTYIDNYFTLIVFCNYIYMYIYIIEVLRLTVKSSKKT